VIHINATWLRACIEMQRWDLRSSQNHKCFLGVGDHGWTALSHGMTDDPITASSLQMTLVQSNHLMMQKGNP
jgi:hypothetical protein